MKLQGFSINTIRNEYEYNKYMPEAYRAEHSYEDVKATFPWLILKFNIDSAQTETDNAILSFDPAADFTGVGESADGAWSAVPRDKAKLKLDLSKFKNNFISFEVKANMGMEELPCRLEASIENSDGSVVKSVWRQIDITDKSQVLCFVDKALRQSNETPEGKLLYDIFAQQPFMKVVDELPENPVDDVLYLIPEEGE